jgi:hypothetical protein
MVEGGRIISIGSVAGSRAPWSGLADYSANKAAVAAWGGRGTSARACPTKVCDHQPNPSLRCILPSPITIVLGGLRWVSSIPHDLFSLSNFNWGTTTHISCFLPLQMLRRGRTAGLGTDWRDGLGSGLVLGHHVESLSGNVQKCVKHLSPH